jgi:NADH-quinone oxidoreductase subunit L
VAPAKAAVSFPFLSAAWASVGTADHEVSAELFLMAASVGIALFGIFLAYGFYVKGPTLPGRFTTRFASLYRVVLHKYCVDEFYDFVFVRGTLKVAGFLHRAADGWMIEGLINGTASAIRKAGDELRKVQTGYVQDYALGIIAGAILVVGSLIVIPLF